jgi:short-subunit dehydrogenase
MHKENKESPLFSCALVTGASSGIGEALCRLLAGKKIPLLMAGRDQTRLNNLAEELRSQVPCTLFSAELSKPRERLLLIEALRTHAPDLVINNAGFGLYGEALSYPVIDHLELLDVNGSSVVELSLEAARALIAAGKNGVVLNVSSAAGTLTFPYFASYAASKALVTQFSRAFDYETAPFGVRILTACPGVVNTPFRQRAAHLPAIKNRGSAMSAEKAARLIWKQILKRKRVYIFDWRTRLGIALAHLLPESLIARLLSNEIKKISPSRSLKL